jgi:hypothetical protein
VGYRGGLRSASKRAGSAFRGLIFGQRGDGEKKQSSKMPRGSKPGERRGGRQRGTPNKKTALHNAVLCAAAAKPNGSPLDFMLGLMRDPNVPTDLRVEMAAAAAPFVHARPQAPPRKRTNPMDSSPIKEVANSTAQKMEEKLSAPEQCGDGGGDLSPLGFLLSVMNDPDAAAQQRIKAARIAARYTHVVVPPDKLPSADEYGFTITRTLAKAIYDDWLALAALGDSSEEAPRRAEIRDRQAQRAESLHCPPGYAPDQDIKRGRELRNKWPVSMAEQTELAFIVARITASEAAFHRSPEGQIRRRIKDLRARRHAASVERNRSVGLTRAEGKELDELLEEYPPKTLPSENLPYHPDLPTGWRRGAAGRRTAGAAGSLSPATGPDLSEMEELPPTSEELREREAELIARRRAAGDPDPWDGKAPRARIYELEQRRYRSEFGGDFTPAEEDELQQIARLYPEDVERLRNMVARRLCGEKRGAEMAGWAGKRGRWQLD